VLNMLCSGCSPRLIARHLGLSVRTVEGHILHLSRKLKARNQAEAVMKAFTLGLAGLPRPVRTSVGA